MGVLGVEGEESLFVGGEWGISLLNANNGDAVQVYRATARTDDVLTKHLHARSARSPILTKGTTLSLSPSRCDTRTFPRHLLHAPPPSSCPKCQRMARNLGSYSFNNLIEKVSIQTGEVPIE
ncbi:hypothetical protein Pcinc_009443 [Petrolisthes cinctipes]|uniref:Uncharacterized protein n=1 Tax=Petrolisthes cinctipes TaxID=88211 RepID=A0AAE1G5F2_PETCI|nr:hypothetical protein Pcinc_009443 [Petrolisthes cinctipes]